MLLRCGFVNGIVPEHLIPSPGGGPYANHPQRDESAGRGQAGHRLQRQRSVKADNTGVETANVKMSMNPFDEIANEEAIRLREKGLATEIIAFSAGPASARRRSAPPSPYGCRPRPSWCSPTPSCSPLAVAKLMKAVVQAIDDDSNQTGQMLAALLGWPQGTFAVKLNRRRQGRGPREVDGGRRTSKIRAAGGHHDRPAPQRAALRPLPNIAKARRSRSTLAPAALGVDRRAAQDA